MAGVAVAIGRGARKNSEAWPANRTKESNHCQCIVPPHVRIWFRAAAEAATELQLESELGLVWMGLYHSRYSHCWTGTDICLEWRQSMNDDDDIAGGSACGQRESFEFSVSSR